MRGYEAKLDAFVRAGGCVCLDHLRAAGITPPKAVLSQIPVTRAYPPANGPRVERAEQIEAAR